MQFCEFVRSWLLLSISLANLRSTIFALQAVPPVATTTTTTNTVTTKSFENSVDAAAEDAAESVGVKGKLVFAHVIFRHGDRTPADPYPTDPWNDHKYWPVGWGQLTNIGKRQHYELGQWLRKRYDSILLNATYREDDIYIRSTDVDRTLMSAYAHLAGLYPPKGDQVWNEDLKWQPIPVHTIPEKLDAVLAAKKPCAAYDYAYSALLNSPVMQKLYDRYAYLFNYLTKYTGRQVTTLHDVQFINNTLFIESLYNKSLPDWTKSVYPSEDMTYLSSTAFTLFTFNRQMARLKTGPLLKEILHRFAAKVDKKLDPDRSVWIYSAHDTTIANLLNTLRLFEPHSPPYTACILMEMRVDAKQNPYISVYYKNTTAEPLPIRIPGCSVNCPLKEMLELYDDVMPEDWEEECKLSALQKRYEEANVGTAVGLLVTIFSIMMLLSFSVTFCFRRHSYRNYFQYSQVA